MGAATFLHVVIVVLLRLCLPRVCHLRPPPPPPSLPPFHFDALSHLLFRIRALLVFRGRRREAKRCLWGIPPSSPANSASRRILLLSIGACVRGGRGGGGEREWKFAPQILFAPPRPSSTGQSFSIQGKTAISLPFPFSLRSDSSRSRKASTGEKRRDCRKDGRGRGRRGCRRRRSRCHSNSCRHR